MTEDAPNQPVPRTRSSFWKKMSVMLFFLLLLMLVVAGIGFAYSKWRHSMLSMKKQDRELRSQTVAQQTSIEKLQLSIQGLQQNLQQTNTHLYKQGETLERIQGTEQGHFDIWRAAYAAYLVRIANDQLKFSYDIPLTLHLLQRADQILQTAETPNLKKIQQTLQADMVRFKNSPSINLTMLYTQLVNLDNQIDQLPLLQLRATKKQEFTDEIPQNMPWWKAGLYHSLAILKKIVVIHRQQDNSLPFILPQEKTLLYQNLHAQIENAFYGLLHRQSVIYQTSLMRLISWVEKYTDQTAPPAQQFLTRLQTLKNQNIEPNTENLDATVAQFDQYLALPTNRP